MSTEVKTQTEITVKADRAGFNTKATIFDSVLIGYLLLVFYVSFTQPDQARMLEMAVNVWYLFGGLGIGAAMSVILNNFGIKTLGGHIFEPAHMKGKGVVQSWYKTIWGLQLIMFMSVTFLVGLLVTEFSIQEIMSERGFAGAIRIFSALATPNFEILPRGILSIIETIFIAFMATAIAIPVAFIMAFLAAKNIMGKNPLGLAFYFFLRTALNVTRSIEPLIWAIIFSVWVGIGPFAGMLALMLHSISSLTKQYSEMIESVDEGPIEGIMATGANSLQVIWFAIVPQLILPYISFTVYRWDINVRMATIIGLVGGGGIGTMLIQYQGQAMWHEVGCLALLIVAVVWMMDTASAYIREALK